LHILKPVLWFLQQFLQILKVTFSFLFILKVK